MPTYKWIAIAGIISAITFLLIDLKALLPAGEREQQRRMELAKLMITNPPKQDSAEKAVLQLTPWEEKNSAVIPKGRCWDNISSTGLRIYPNDSRLYSESDMEEVNNCDHKPKKRICSIGDVDLKIYFDQSEWTNACK